MFSLYSLFSSKAVFTYLLYKEWTLPGKLGTFQREFDLWGSARRCHGGINVFHRRERGARRERRWNSGIETKRCILRGLVETTETRRTRCRRRRTRGRRGRGDRRGATVELGPTRALSIGFCRINSDERRTTTQQDVTYSCAPFDRSGHNAAANCRGEHIARR